MITPEINDHLTPTFNKYPLSHLPGLSHESGYTLVLGEADLGGLGVDRPAVLVLLTLVKVVREQLVPGHIEYEICSDG